MARLAKQYFGLAILLTMAALAAVGYYAIRRDVQNLQAISQDNILWTATQMEVELLRFQLSIAALEIERSQDAVASVRDRFELLWSRVSLMDTGRVGDVIQRYDRGHGDISALQGYLTDLEPIVKSLSPEDTAQMAVIMRELESFQDNLRNYALRVMRGGDAASAQVRNRIQTSSQATMTISLVAVALGVLALILILRENRRQREVAELSRRGALEAEQSSRAKSRFLTMMSHELRNPMNGVLGPLALLGQSDLAARHRRLVEQAQQSGKSMVRMIAGLLDYGELQDGRMTLHVEPFRLSRLAASVQADLAEAGLGGVQVRMRPGSPEVVCGDIERLRHVFLHLTEYVLDGSDPESVVIEFACEADRMVGTIEFTGADAAIDWKLDLLMGLNKVAPDQVSSEALRPLIARGLIAAANGVLTLADCPDGRPAIRVSLPAPSVRYERIRVRLETRSSALSAIYQVALRSDRVTFVGEDDQGQVDIVMIDATSVGEEPLMARLRARFPNALFMSLGEPQTPDSFDEIVDSPADMSRLRSRILGRLSV